LTTSFIPLINTPKPIIYTVLTLYKLFGGVDFLKGFFIFFKSNNRLNCFIIEKEGVLALFF